MLFPKDLKEVARLVGEMQKPGSDEEGLARQLIDVDPTFAPAYATLGLLQQEKGNFDEAESLVWQALELWPLSFRIYEALAQMRNERDSGDALARRLQHLATWKLALGGEIPEEAANRYAALFGDKIGDTRDPETFEVLATVEDVRLKKSPPPPDVEERLRPYILLHDLQNGARRVVSHDTVKDIVEHADECRPLLRGVLREWLRNTADVSDAMACLSAALLGEIGDRETLEELIVLSQNEIAFLHAHWAIHRIATRLPQDTLDVFRAVIPTASAGERCGLADHLYLMDPAPGMAELLIALTENFPVEADDAAYLLMSVTAALEDLGEDDLAQAVVQRCEPLLNARAARIRRKALDSEEGFVPTLEFEEIDKFDIYEVCLERVYLDEDEEGEDEDIEVPPAPVLAQPKLGRNDPCWCGSSKKYKKCHLEADERGKREEPEAVSDTPPWTPPGLISRIVQSTFDYHNSSERTKAKQLFFDTIGEVEAEEAEVGRFVQWLIFDYRNPRTGKTGLQHFVEVEGRRLKPRERDFLDSLAGVRLELYEVQSVEPGRGVWVKDLYADETHFVRDISSSRELVQWDCLLARIHTYEGHDLFVGDGTGVPRQWLPDLKNWIDDQSLAQGMPEEDFVAANSHRMHRVVLAIREEKISSVKLVTAEGDEMEFSHGHYEVVDQAVLLAALREQPEIVEQTDEEDGGEYHFGWLEGRPKDTGTRSLGHIYIRGGRLRLETTSRPRLKKGRRMLEKIAKRVLKHLGDSYESAQQAMNRLKTEPADANRKPSAPVPPEVEREVVQRFKAEHYAKWPDEALPALGGKTPRQAMKTPGGRRAVEDLLRTFENLERRESREDDQAYDFSSLRRDLGLDL